MPSTHKQLAQTKSHKLPNSTCETRLPLIMVSDLQKETTTTVSYSRPLISFQRPDWALKEEILRKRSATLSSTPNDHQFHTLKSETENPVSRQRQDDDLAESMRKRHRTRRENSTAKRRSEEAHRSVETQRPKLKLKIKSENLSPHLSVVKRSASPPPTNPFTATLKSTTSGSSWKLLPHTTRASHPELYPYMHPRDEVLQPFKVEKNGQWIWLRSKDHMRLRRCLRAKYYARKAGEESEEAK